MEIFKGAPPPLPLPNLKDKFASPENMRLSNLSFQEGPGPVQFKTISFKHL